MIRFWLFFIPLLFSISLYAKPIPICVVIPSYNNESWCIENMDSLRAQTYKYWKAVYINDCSQDKTAELTQSYIQKYNLQKKITFINNKKREGALFNIYHAVQSRKPREIVVILDGDDQLSNPDVLSYIAQIYEKNPELWLTYGTFVSKPYPRRCCCGPVPKRIISTNSFRSFRYVSSHLRTFYAGLFQKIKKEDLMDGDRFLASAGDVATMIPMLEMASKGHFRYIRKILYIHRNDNPLNDFNNRPEQRRCSQLVRSRPAYTPLEKAAW
jgi:glycosyltransferase involved in cell wall biosynthesis